METLSNLESIQAKSFITLPCRYMACKAYDNKYGYTVIDTLQSRKDWLGLNCTAGWYKLKKDAIQRANEYNKAENRGTYCAYYNK